jgi:hypothetical protein
MKTVMIISAAAILATTAVAEAASTARTDEQHNAGWASRQHVYAAGHYAPWYPSYGNSNMNPDFQLVR